LIAAPRFRRFRLSPQDWRNIRTALPFIAPWIIGFLAFTVYPIAYSLYLSFTNYSGFGDATAAGLDNYKYMWNDTLF
jgi:multiple sugar transport system permease protein